MQLIIIAILTFVVGVVAIILIKFVGDILDIPLDSLVYKVIFILDIIISSEELKNMIMMLKLKLLIIYPSN